MREWISIELLLAILLVTTFTCIGTLALWVATSPRHWFVRTAAAFAVFSPLLLIPAYGPFLTFWSIIALVVVGVGMYRLWGNWRDAKLDDTGHHGTKPNSRWQFSIKSALAVCTCLAVMSALAVKIPLMTWAGWPVITIAAAVVAIITLLAAWIVNGRGTLRERIGSEIAISMVLIGCAVLAAKHSEPMPQMFGYPLSAFLSIDDHFQTSLPQLALFFIVAAGLFAALIVTLLLIRANYWSGSQTSSSRTRRNLARLAIIPWALLILGPPTLTLVTLVQPLPKLDTILPTPNGYDELARIGKRFHASAIMSELAADVVDEAKLDAAVPQYEADFVALRKALGMPFRIPIQYDIAADIVNDDFSSIVSLILVLDAKADAAMRSGNIDESLAWRMDTLRLAQSINHSGLLYHFLRASGFEGDENAHIYRTVPAMKSAQLQAAIRGLADYDHGREQFEKIRQRELAWNVKTNGWPNRIRYLFDNLIGRGTINFSQETIYRIHQAVNRLLQVEMALRLHQLDRGNFPTTLIDLVPNYLPSLPDDPFAVKPQPFHYAVAGNKFKLWSVGPDGEDDGGTPLSKNEYGGNDWQGNGDVVLDSYFARYEPPSGHSNNGATSSEEQEKVSPTKLNVDGTDKN